MGGAHGTMPTPKYTIDNKVKKGKKMAAVGI